MSAPNTIGSLLYSFATISWIIYLWIIFTLFKYRKTLFDSSFYRMSIVLGLVDVVRAFAFMVTCVICGWAWFPEFYRSNWLFATIGGLTVNCLMWTQKVMNLTMSFNRFTAIVFATKHKQMWTTGVELGAFVAIAALTPVLASPWIATAFFGLGFWPVNSTDYNPLNTSDTFVMLADQTKVPPILYQVMFGHLAVGSGITVLLYVLLYSWMLLHWHCSARVTSRWGTEAKLALAAAVLGAIQSLNSMYSVLVMLWPQEFIFTDLRMYYNRWAVLILTDCLANPWILIALSDRVRQAMVPCSNNELVANSRHSYRLVRQLPSLRVPGRPATV